MFDITRSASGYIYVSTKGLETLTNPSYLITFVCVSTKDTRYCWVSDSSSYPDRYQRFLIKETASPVSGTYEVLLDTTGTWDYYIYEYTGSAPSDETGLNQVKEGQCEVLHTASTLQTYGSYQTTFKKYGS